MNEAITQALDNLVHWQGFSGDAGPQEAADLIRQHIEKLEARITKLEAERIHFGIADYDFSPASRKGIHADG